MTDTHNDNDVKHGHDINTPLVVTIGVVSVVLVFGVVIPGVIALVYEVKDRHVQQNVVSQQYTQLRAHEADQYERITGKPRWINASQGVVGISIDDAMKLYADRHADRNNESTP